MARYTITWTESRVLSATIGIDFDPSTDEDEAIRQAKNTDYKTEDVEHQQILSIEEEGQ